MGSERWPFTATADESSTTTFRIDLYSSDGNFIRNITPPNLAVVFQDSVVWTSDSNYNSLCRSPECSTSSQSDSGRNPAGTFAAVGFADSDADDRAGIRAATGLQHRTDLRLQS